MNGDQPILAQTILIKSVGFYLALFDRVSPANRPGRAHELLDLAEQRVAPEEWRSLFAFNDILAQRARAGELMSWTLASDGVFQIRVELWPPLARIVVGPEEDDRLPALHGEETFLDCPSGEILITSLFGPGEAIERPAITLVPGRYRVQLAGDNQQQFKHEFLESISEYPEGDGPDWVVYLQPVESVSPSSVSSPETTGPPS